MMVLAFVDASSVPDPLNVIAPEKVSVELLPCVQLPVNVNDVPLEVIFPLLVTVILEPFIMVAILWVPESA